MIFMDDARATAFKKATLQGLAKMHALTSLGLKQGVLPPQEHPFFLPCAPHFISLGIDSK